MPRVAEDFALAKLIGHLYTEVFQSKPQNPNKPINHGVHTAFHQHISDDFKSRLIPSSVVTKWGPGGASDETGISPSSARWGFTAVWG
jgi:hypothetical protein